MAYVRIDIASGLISLTDFYHLCFAVNHEKLGMVKLLETTATKSLRVCRIIRVDFAKVMWFASTRHLHCIVVGSFRPCVSCHNN